VSALKTCSLKRLLAAVLVLSAVASPAFAATPSASLSSLSVTVDAANSALLISGTLAADAKLPATVELPVPSGANPYWVGQILGGDPSKDSKATFTIVKAKGHDLVVFTVTQSRTGQAEVNVPAASAVGGSTSLSYSLPIAVKVGVASLGFELPAGSTVSSSTSGLISGQGASGQRVLEKTVVNPKVGSILTASVSYALGVAAAGAAVAAVGAAPGASSGDPANLLAIVLWIFAAGLAALFAKTVFDRRAAARRAEAAAADDEADPVEAEEDFAFEADSPPRATRARKPAAQGTSAPPKRASMSTSAGVTEAAAKKTPATGRQPLRTKPTEGGAA
jgi:hypothetical protein